MFLIIIFVIMFCSFFQFNISVIVLCNLLGFFQSGTSIEEHIQDIAGSAQPCLLALGRIIQFTSFDQHAIPCKSVSSLDAFDELCNGVNLPKN